MLKKLGERRHTGVGIVTDKPSCHLKHTPPTAKATIQLDFTEYCKDGRSESTEHRHASVTGSRDPFQVNCTPTCPLE